MIPLHHWGQACCSTSQSAQDSPRRKTQPPKSSVLSIQLHFTERTPACRVNPEFPECDTRRVYCVIFLKEGEALTIDFPSPQSSPSTKSFLDESLVSTDSCQLKNLWAVFCGVLALTGFQDSSVLRTLGCPMSQMGTL